MACKLQAVSTITLTPNPLLAALLCDVHREVSQWPLHSLRLTSPPPPPPRSAPSLNSVVPDRSSKTNLQLLVPGISATKTHPNLSSTAGGGEGGYSTDREIHIIQQHSSMIRCSSFSCKFRPPTTSQHRTKNLLVFVAVENGHALCTSQPVAGSVIFLPSPKAITHTEAPPGISYPSSKPQQNQAPYTRR